ncbi:translation initiation factor IF-2-like [Nycticebus coucang]|uniref:translation initiation factor IF-2-like n=1 Tax=Nycticebus coucang TaxID=9470 RepID=UPI00234DD91B|nr:translation initiation factor IF-2-like [Nycticebus coucang]XP_053430526.1 translation initiation factor IF-2-like [Nycticebus coucang]
MRGPPTSRPVAPQSASYRDVVASPRRWESSAGESREGQRGGAEAGGSPRGGQTPEPARGQTRPGRASAGARGCECAMRARRGECVCPRFPLPSPSVLWPDRAMSCSRRPSRLERLHRRVQPRRGAFGNRRPGAAAPRARARVPLRCASESERGAERAGCVAAATARGGCRPRPPAARLFPFSLHPLAPSPHALQGSQTGLQHPQRRELAAGPGAPVGE